jgi:hypothetical protein
VKYTGIEDCIRILDGKSKWKGLLWRSGVDCRMILKIMFKEIDVRMRMRIGLDWIGLDPRGFGRCQ